MARETNNSKTFSVGGGGAELRPYKSKEHITSVSMPQAIVIRKRYLSHDHAKTETSTEWSTKYQVHILMTVWHV